MRNLEIMGEATKSLSDEFRAKYSEIPWKSMAGVRDRLIHHYFGVKPLGKQKSRMHFIRLFDSALPYSAALAAANTSS